MSMISNEASVIDEGTFSVRRTIVIAASLLRSQTPVDSGQGQELRHEVRPCECGFMWSSTQPTTGCRETALEGVTECHRLESLG